MDIKIIVAVHKIAKLPQSDSYFPLHVGRVMNNSIGLCGDDTGDNISYKNENYCELTGIYWAWKNLAGDYIGLVHYRRYFKKRGCIFGDKWKCIASHNDIAALLNKAPIVVPKKRNYYIESVYWQYAHAHRKSDMDLIGEIIKDKHPEYYAAFERMKIRKCAHMFNMFVMRRDYFHAYCSWLFDILFIAERKLAGNHEKRLFGYLSERLLDVWLETKNVNYVECDIVSFGVECSLLKGIKMFCRKFGYGK
ncbi:DUF4422 domain-containing protein [Anaerovibrio slackiae]|uniref:DUF4422 domain-containing protein n=1 Tax=Anaerovibrio slackiae TaxID=2652309 RepID=UPI003863A8FC